MDKEKCFVRISKITLQPIGEVGQKFFRKNEDKIELIPIFDKEMCDPMICRAIDNDTFHFKSYEHIFPFNKQIKLVFEVKTFEKSRANAKTTL